MTKQPKCQCAYCRSGMQADFIKRWKEYHKKEVKDE